MLVYGPTTHGTVRIEAADRAGRESTPDPALLPTPAFEFDQRLTW
jgi:hypothetical protein